MNCKREGAFAFPERSVAVVCTVQGPVAPSTPRTQDKSAGNLGTSTTDEDQSAGILHSTTVVERVADLNLRYFARRPVPREIAFLGGGCMKVPVLVYSQSFRVFYSGFGNTGLRLLIGSPATADAIAGLCSSSDCVASDCIPRRWTPDSRPESRIAETAIAFPEMIFINRNRNLHAVATSRSGVPAGLVFVRGVEDAGVPTDRSSSVGWRCRGPHGQVFVRGVEGRGPHGQVFVRGVEGAAALHCTDYGYTISVKMLKKPRSGFAVHLLLPFFFLPLRPSGIYQ